MTTTTATLTQFLLDRISDDEADADGKHDRFDCDLVSVMYGSECTCNYPVRVLAECKAKRAIVIEVDERPPSTWGVTQGVLSILAAVYEDHPDYQKEWRP